MAKQLVFDQVNPTKTLVCIDCFCGCEVSGRLYNPYVMGPIYFSGMFGMIKQIEKLVEAFSYAQPMFQYRSFKEIKRSCSKPKRGREAQRCMNEDVIKENQGKRATFVVQVQFQQNATWQGRIQWLDKKKAQNFRSTLEMIRLMDEALSEEQDLIDETCWESEPGKAI